MREQSIHNPDDHPTPERRCSVRVCCTGFVEGMSTAPSKLFRGEIRNVSETGCLIYTRANVGVAPGTTVELSFKFAGAGYSALGRVIEALPSSRIRIQFIATDPTFTERIRDICGSTPPGRG
jgi:hypothetical protein